MVEAITPFLALAAIWMIIDLTCDILLAIFPGKRLRQAQKEYDKAVAENKKLEKEIAIMEEAMKDNKPEDTIRFLEHLDSTLNERGIKT